MNNEIIELVKNRLVLRDSGQVYHGRALRVVDGAVVERLKALPVYPFHVVLSPSLAIESSFTLEEALAGITTNDILVIDERSQVAN